MTIALDLKFCKANRFSNTGSIYSQDYDSSAYLRYGRQWKDIRNSDCINEIIHGKSRPNKEVCFNTVETRTEALGFHTA